MYPAKDVGRNAVAVTEAGLLAPTEDERYVHGFLLNNEGLELGDRLRRIAAHLVACGDHARVAPLASIGAQFSTRSE